MKTVQCVGVAVVIHDNCVLVGTRDAGSPLAGYAEFPGGKCDSGESPEACAVRECREETGLAVGGLERIDETEFEYPHGTVRVTFLRCGVALESVGKSPGGSFRWVPIAEAVTRKFPEANAKVVAWLRTQ